MRCTAAVFAAAWCAIGHPSPAAAEERDPFAFGPRAKPAVIAVAPSVNAPMLIGVLWDATAPLAMIGDQTVAPGERVGDCLVTEIQQDGVWVECASARHFITPGSSLPLSSSSRP